MFTTMWFMMLGLMQEQVPGHTQMLVDLPKLSQLTRSIERRCRETEFDPAVSWCDSVLAATEGLELGVDRNASMHLLGHAALNLHQIFHPDKSPARTDCKETDHGSC